MEYRGVEEIQCGRTGLLTGVWSNIISGSFDVAIWQCPNCGKIEFYDPEIAEPPEVDRENT
jgi:hypothetical protein